MKFKSFNHKTKIFWDHLLNISSSTKEFRYILLYESYMTIYVVLSCKFEMILYKTRCAPTHHNAIMN